MIPIGCSSIDKLLGGGLLEGVITQVYGSPGSGKTNIALYTSYTASKMNKKIAFIDTENSFHHERVNQIFMENELLNNIDLINVKNFQEQEEAIEEVVNENYDLVIIDSMTSLYRVERTDDNYYDVNRVLGKQALKLLNYAREENIPVLITNQVYTNTDTGLIEPVGGSILKYYSKVILEVMKTEEGRKVVLKKHLSRKDGEEAEFKIVENGIISHGLYS